MWIWGWEGLGLGFRDSQVPLSKYKDCKIGSRQWMHLPTDQVVVGDIC